MAALHEQFPLFKTSRSCHDSVVSAIDRCGMKIQLIYFPVLLYLQLRGYLSQNINNTVFRPSSLEQLQQYLTTLIYNNNTDQHRCPAPIWPIDDEKCSARPCRTRRDCKDHLCCFNGCVFTCTREMEPAPVIDWLQDTEVNPVALPDAAVQSCSSSPRPAPSQPTGCPVGYICRIQDPGDPLKGIPSSGTCVPHSTEEVSFSEDESNLFKEKIGKDTVYLPGGCMLTAKQYEHMQQFMLKSYVVDCFCIKGSVECQVML